MLNIDLGGKTALVTGASRGIGREIALSLGQAGARLAVAARSQSDLDALASELGDRTLVFPIDLLEAEAGRRLSESVLGAVGAVDILVNNAGIAHNRRSENVRPSAVCEVLQVNLAAALDLTIGLAPAMFDRGGSIINISSMSGAVGTPGQAVYAASKAGLDAATRSLACEWGPRRVRVNAVAPGLIITDMWERGRQQPGLADTLEKNVALRRWGLPADVAKVVSFLASDLAGYITGQTILVDGGLANMFDVLRG